MAKRKPISKKTRFEIFKRDSFTCQYCGRKAPDVLLEVDHIKPVAKDGPNDILNLITSCFDCNSGKSDRELSDTAVIDKQRSQLEQLQERREQIDLMFQWKKQLLNLDDGTVDRICEVFCQGFPGVEIPDDSKKDLKKLLKQFSLSEVLDAVQIAAEQYCELDDNGEATYESAEKAFYKLGGICRLSRIDKEDPSLRQLYYIRGICRNRFSYCDESRCLRLLVQANDLGAGHGWMKEHAQNSSSWTTWRQGMEELIDEGNKMLEESSNIETENKP